MNILKKVLTVILPIVCSIVLFTGFEVVAPIPGAAANQIRFAVISDYGDALDSAGGASPSSELAVSTLVHSWTPDLILTAGDNNMFYGDAGTIDGNIGQYYHDYIYPYTGNYGSGATTNKLFPSPGNHDWGYSSDNNLSAYRNYFALPGNERYYDFAQGSVHFFMLDANSTEPDGWSSTSTQAKWLQTQLSSATEPFKVVVCHQPPYSSGSAHGSTSIMQWPFKAWGASVVISGHDHDYERLNIGGLPYFVVGTGGDELRGWGSIVSGSQVRWNSNYGAMLVTADSASMVIQFYSIAGTLVDTYTINSSVSTPTPTPSGSTFGLNSGESLWSADASVLNAMRFQNTVGSGTLNKLELQVSDSTTSGKVRLGVYADNGGKPGSRLLDAGEATVTNGWVSISGLNLPVIGNAYYWLAFNLQNTNDLIFLCSTANTAKIPHYWTSGTTYGALPSTFNLSGASNNLGPYVMRATVTTGTVTATKTFGLSSGNNTWDQSANILDAMRFQNTAGSGTLNKLELLISDSTPTGKVRFGVYADNAGKPGNRLLDAGEATVTNGWVSISNLNLTVSSGSYYWLVFVLQNGNTAKYQSGQAASSHYWTNYTYATLPGAYPTTNLSTNSSPYTMRASVAAK